MRYGVGIDIGGSLLRAAVVREDGYILARTRSGSHAEQEPRQVIAEAVRLYESVVATAGLAKGDTEGIGLGFAGTVNGPEGIVLVSSNLPDWDHFPLRDELSAATGARVEMDNDSNLGALGELKFGAGRGRRDLAYVTLSTGFGLGLIIDGRVYRGACGTAAEIAHMSVTPDGPPCTCGKRGCLMSYASGVGLSRMAWDAVDSGVATCLRDYAPPDRRRITGEQIAACVRRGDYVAQDILQTCATYVGIGLASIVQVLNPEMIVVGGGLTRIGPALMEPAMDSFRRHCQPELVDCATIVDWTLGDDVTLLGAAAMVLNAGDRRDNLP